MARTKHPPSTRTITSTQLQRGCREILRDIDRDPRLTVSVTLYHTLQAVIISPEEHERLMRAWHTLRDLEDGKRVTIDARDAERLARIDRGESPLPVVGP